MGDVGAGHALVQSFDQGRNVCLRGCRRHRIAGEVIRFDDAQQRPARIDDQDLCALRVAAANQFAAQRAQRRRLAALRFSEHDEVRLSAEVDGDGP